MRRLLTLLTMTLVAAGLAPAADAGDLRIGRATEHGSLDPLYSDLGSDVATAENAFESMIRFDSKLRIHPSLATEWKLIDPLTWDIKLRPGVTFHDGSALTAADVAYSLNRARDIPNSPGPLSSFVRPVKAGRDRRSADVTDPHRRADAFADGHDRPNFRVAGEARSDSNE